MSYKKWYNRILILGMLGILVTPFLASRTQNSVMNEAHVMPVRSGNSAVSIRVEYGLSPSPGDNFHVDALRSVLP